MTPSAFPLSLEEEGEVETKGVIHTSNKIIIIIIIIIVIEIKIIIINKKVYITLIGLLVASSLFNGCTMRLLSANGD